MNTKRYQSAPDEQEQIPAILKAAGIVLQFEASGRWWVNRGDGEDRDPTAEEAEETRYSDPIGEADLSEETTEHDREDDPSSARSSCCDPESGGTVFREVGRNRGYRWIKPLERRGKQVERRVGEENTHQPSSQPK